VFLREVLLIIESCVGEGSRQVRFSRGRILLYANERQQAEALFLLQQTLSYGSLGSKRD
jgi:hypothetical protein